MPRIASTFTATKIKQRLATKTAPVSPSEVVIDALVSAAQAAYQEYEEKTMTNMIRAVVAVVKDAPSLGPEEYVFTGSTTFDTPLLTGAVLDLYKYAAKVRGAPLTDIIEEGAFFMEYYTNIRLLNGNFTPMSVKVMGMEPFAYGSMECDINDQPDEYMIDFFYNILKLGLVTEEEIDYFLNMPLQTQNNIEGYLLDENKVRILLEKGQHIVFSSESIGSTAVLLDSVKSFISNMSLPLL